MLFLPARHEPAKQKCCCERASQQGEHLKGNGEHVKVVQESLRHANSRITLDAYTQALTPAKREAQTKVVKMILPERIQTTVAGGGK